jgi:hypothetical protein
MADMLPPPPGFQLEQDIPPPPPGFVVGGSHTTGPIEGNPTDPGPDMTEAEFTKERQRLATDDPTFRKLAAAAIPTAAGIATMGSSVPIQMGIGAAATTLNQVLGLEPYSAGNVAASGLIPGVIPGLSKIPGVKDVVPALGKLFAPPAYRKAATGAAVETLGGEADLVTRLNAIKPSKVAYAAAEANAQEVPTNVMTRGITTAINTMPQSNRPEKAITYLQNLHKVLDTEGSLPYAKISKELEGMYATAKGMMRAGSPDYAAGKAIMDARQVALKELEKVSAELPEANAFFRREMSIEKVARAMDQPRPNVRLGELLSKDNLVKSSIPEDIQQKLMKIADMAALAGTVASPVSSGMGRIMDFAGYPLAQFAFTKTGQYMMRQVLKGGTVTLPKLAILANFARAYAAQGGGDEPQ